jgi:hypothetical protein
MRANSTWRSISPRALVGLTRHTISDRESRGARLAAKGWLANTHNVNRSTARGSLRRLVRRVGMAARRRGMEGLGDVM